MAETTAQIPGGANLQIDLAQLNAIISNVVVQVCRQVMVIGDPNNQGGQVAVSLGGQLLADVSKNDLMRGTLRELEKIRVLLENMSGVDLSEFEGDHDNLFTN